MAELGCSYYRSGCLADRCDHFARITAKRSTARVGQGRRSRPQMVGQEGAGLMAKPVVANSRATPTTVAAMHDDFATCHGWTIHTSGAVSLFLLGTSRTKIVTVRGASDLSLPSSLLCAQT